MIPERSVYAMQAAEVMFTYIVSCQWCMVRDGEPEGPTYESPIVSTVKGKIQNNGDVADILERTVEYITEEILPLFTDDPDVSVKLTRVYSITGA